MVNRDNERRHEVSERAQKQLDSFSREAERKLAEKMELTSDNKEAYITALQHRCHLHVRPPFFVAGRVIIIIIRIYYGAAQPVLSSTLQYNNVIVDSGN